MFAPEFLVPDPPHYESFCRAVEETDRVISVSECTAHQFEEVYGYEGPVEVVRYHNLPLFEEPVPLPDGPPWRIGYMGRLSIKQKNLDTLLQAVHQLRNEGMDVELHLHGDGTDRKKLEKEAQDLEIGDDVIFHGGYDHRTELPEVIGSNHVFTYTSNYEGGPCFTLLELLQAGRYVVASPVGGIPDIYKDHPESGMLVDPEDPVAIAETLRNAIEKLTSGGMNPDRIRARYHQEFDMEAAHEEWRQALNLSNDSPLVPDISG
nr:glycosyltransferase [Salinibacter ruber]